MVIKVFGSPGEDICELAEVSSLVDFEKEIVQVEGKRIRSLEELKQILSTEPYRDREFLEVVLLPSVMGG